MTERELMARIHDLHQRMTAALHGARTPVALLAAIVANESRAQAAATRFEPGVYSKLCLAALGHREFHDPSLSRPIEQQEWLREADFAMAIRPGTGAFPSFMQAGLEHLAAISTSYGYTQLMGWHALEWRVTLVSLADPQTHFRHAARLLAFFEHKYQLDASRDFEALLRCWNTGRPAGATHDPAYVEKALSRMQLYQEVT